MNKTFRLLPLLAASAVVVGCQDYDLDVNIDDVRYKENFVAAFGQIDPNQNWDLYGQLAAGQGGMTRATAAPNLGDVEIEDLPESQYAYLTKEEAMRYQKMLPESKEDNLEYAQTNLGRVVQNFKVKTERFVLYPVHWNTSSKDDIGFYYHVPEGTSGAVAVTDVDGNVNYIIKVEICKNKTHLWYTQDDEYGFVFWYATDGYDRVLSYWAQLAALKPERYIEEGGVKKVKIGDAPSVEFDSHFANSSYGDELWIDLVAIDPDVFVVSDGSLVNKWGNPMPNGTKSVGLPIERTWKDVGGDDGVRSTQDALSVWKKTPPTKMLQSRGIVVQLPEAAEIGMYLTNGSNTFYSESKLNKKTDWGGEIGAKESCFVATYLDEHEDHTPVLDKDGNQVRYLCFEDWYGVKNFDLNDVIFRVYGFDGPGSEVVDFDDYTEEALLVCEDLGDFDFDFNDIVLKLGYKSSIKRTTYFKNDGSDEVDHVDMTNSESIFVTPMAAGGANPSYIIIHIASSDSDTEDTPLWNKTYNGDGEIHKLLGGSAPTIINAGPIFGGEGETNSYPWNYGASWDKSEYPTYLSMLFDKGFIKIVSSGKNANAITSNGSYTTTGNAPQMMLLPMSFEWPQEGQRISEVYPEFSTWVSDVTATDWINNNNGKVTKR